MEGRREKFSFDHTSSVDKGITNINTDDARRAIVSREINVRSDFCRNNGEEEGVRFLLLQDGTTIGSFPSSSPSPTDRNRGDVSNPPPTSVAAIVMEPNGSCFTAVHRDGTVIRQVTSCCTSRYEEKVRAVLLFRNASIGSIRDLCDEAVPFVCRNLYPPYPGSVEPLARWPSVVEDRECVSSNVTDFGSDDSDLAFTIEQDGSVKVTAILHHGNGTEPSILHLSPTGHFAKISYPVTVPQMDPLLTTYGPISATEHAHTRVTQVFSSRRLFHHDCFGHPLQLAKAIQRWHRLRGRTNLTTTGKPSFSFPMSLTENSSSEYVSTPLPAPHPTRDRPRWTVVRDRFDDPTEEDRNSAKLIPSEIIALSRIRQPGSLSSYFTHHVALEEWTTRATYRAILYTNDDISCHQGPLEVDVEVTIHEDGDSCLTLSGEFFRYHKMEPVLSSPSPPSSPENGFTKDCPETKLVESLYHKSAACHLVRHPGKEKELRLGEICRKALTFREQILQKSDALKNQLRQRSERDEANFPTDAATSPPSHSTTSAKRIHSPSTRETQTFENETGSYTRLPDGQIHVRFRDRTILHTDPSRQTCDILFEDATVSKNVSTTHPREEAAEYVALAMQFASWVDLSPEERRLAELERDETERVMIAEADKIRRFLILSDRTRWDGGDLLMEYPSQHSCGDDSLVGGEQTDDGMIRDRVKKALLETEAMRKSLLD